MKLIVLKKIKFYTTSNYSVIISFIESPYALFDKSTLVHSFSISGLSTTRL